MAVEATDEVATCPTNMMPRNARDHDSLVNRPDEKRDRPPCAPREIATRTFEPSARAAAAMDGDAPPAWSADVETFTSPDRAIPDASRADALRRLVALLGADSITFLDLLRGMEACLVTTEDSRRARGVLLLAETVAGYVAPPASRPLPAGAASLLAQYFSSKLDDFAVIRAALMGCATLLRADAAHDDGVVTPAVDRAGACDIADRFFDAVHVPSLVQADRQRSYELILALLDHPSASDPEGPPLGAELTPAEQLETIVAACDGEKDPRNVILVCDIWSTLPRAFCGSADEASTEEPDGVPTAGPRPSDEHRAAFAAAAEELYDVVAAYFPVSFRPPPNAPPGAITRERLAATLRGAMCASAAYAPWAAPHVLESLHPDKPPHVVEDAFAAAAACGSAFGARAMAPHLNAAWGAMRGVLLRPPAGPELDAEGAARWATRLFAAEWSGDVDDASSLARLALADASLADAAAALSPNGGADGENKNESAAGGCCGGEGQGGDGCCGGSASGSSAAEVTRRGHALVAGAGRIIGAVAAAGPAYAAAAASLGLAPLLDAAGVGSDGDVSAVVDGAAPLALVLATPVACGALDGAVRAGDVAGDVDALGSTGARLAGLFAAAATNRVRGAEALRADDPDADAADDGATLGVAGLATLLAFPAKTKSLTTEDALGAAVDALVDAATNAASSANVRRRAGDALGAAATAADFESAAFVARRAAPALLRRAESESSFESSLSSLALAALARLASSSAAARRACAPALCDAAANDGVLMTRFDHAALVDALAGVAIDAGTETTDRSGSSRSSPTSAFSRSSPTSDFSPPGILPSAAAASTADSRASEEEDAACARLARATLARASVATGAVHSARAERECRLARAATAACSAAKQGPVLREAYAVVAEAKDETETGTETETTSPSLAFRVAAAVVCGARRDADAFAANDDSMSVTSDSVVAALTRRALTDESDDVSAAAADALASVLHKRGDSDASLFASASSAGLGSSLDDARGVRVAARALRATASRANPAARALTDSLVRRLVSSNAREAAGAARALGDAMAPNGGGPGLARASHGAEKPLFRQRFFSQTLPGVLARLAPSAGVDADADANRSRRPAHLCALAHLARHAPVAAVLQAGDAVVPLLPEAARTLSTRDSPYADVDALAATATLAAAFLSDPRGRTAMETHADEHAGAIVEALCRLGGGGRDGDATTLEVRETAMEALVAATSLPFAAVYPQRRAVAAAATKALDDPKRRVRRAAAKCREVWLALDAKAA